MPKFYFIDNGFRNFLINRFEFLDDEKWLLFENFIYSEFLKKWINYEEIKFWRTKNGVNEVDFVFESLKKIYEVKYKEKTKKSDLDWINSFNKHHEWFNSLIINKENFYSLTF
jgi:hypothetical protein